MNREEIQECIATLLDNKERGLRWSSVFKTVDVRALYKDDMCAIICEFFTSEDYREKAILKLPMEDLTCGIIETWAYSIVKELKVIDKLNDRLRDYFAENNSSISVEFRWSTSEVCEIADWNYDSLQIKLSTDAIDNLCSYEETIESLFGDFEDFNDNIIDYIKGFNNRSFNKTLGAKMSNDNSIFDKLTEHMLNFNDIKKLINPKNKGLQSIKSVIAFRDLGMLGIFNIDIDYTGKQVTVKASENKLVDTDKSKVVRNAELCNGICSLIALKIKDNLLWAG